MSRYRNFVFTHNNYENTDLEDTIECRYIAYSFEVAPTTGTPHLQGYISFANAKALSAVIRLLPGCHIERMIGSFEDNEAYCSKAGQLIERGERPMSNEDKGANNKKRWDDSRLAGEEGRFEDIPSDLYIKHMNSFHKLAVLNMKDPDPNWDVKCFWIWGETNTGKSHCVWEHFKDSLYRKNMDGMQWYDGYYGQDCVYFEDFGRFHIKWSDHIKVMADVWPVKVQVKNSMMSIRPKYVVVSSNESPETLWYGQNDLPAILRRFTIVEKTSQEQVIPW